ncbi:MAG: hypothetical protein KA243_11245 [Candidatus Aminicenantes bacterium]|nr:hypothetical protein [Candidatus Aminicenantes bacterium]NLH75490.1 hypothetical protein [Acidobacteriota bacterium]
MKKTLGLAVLAVLVALLGAACIRYVPYDESGRYGREYDDYYDRTDRYDRYDDLDSAYFYNELQPHGLWVSYRPYGYVWIPGNVGYGWRPYTRGHWAWTDYGWTWVSLERWGWIAFHYGRWGWDRRLGWFWVPDVVWGPAWVAWRWGDAHIGWAPLPPGVDFVRGRGFGGHRWDIPGDHWNFVHGRYFLDRSLDRRVLPVERNLTIVNMTSLRVNIEDRNDRVVNEGVDRDVVRRLTAREVERYTLKDPGRAGEQREEGTDLILSKPPVRRNEAAKPREVLDPGSAERRLTGGDTPRIYRQPVRGEAEAVREDHEQERWLMRDSQEAELREVRRRTDEEKARVRNEDEKKKLEEQASARIGELKAKHGQEKAELEKRQKAEEAKAKARPAAKPVRKKTDGN